MRCGKNVEGFEKANSFFDDKLIFAAICHGERELCYFGKKEQDELTNAIRHGRIVESKAFDDSIKKIENI